MPERYLEIEYRPIYWAHHLRAEIGKTPALAAADANWAASALLDLAFSLETRIGNLIEIQRQTDENLRVVGQELASRSEIESLVEGGYAYRVQDEAALRRVIIGLNSLVVESRSCFENLAKFYREFVRNYFKLNNQIPALRHFANLARFHKGREDRRPAEGYAEQADHREAGRAHVHQRVDPVSHSR